MGDAAQHGKEPMSGLASMILPTSDQRRSESQDELRRSAKATNSGQDQNVAPTCPPISSSSYNSGSEAEDLSTKSQGEMYGEEEEADTLIENHVSKSRKISQKKMLEQNSLRHYISANRTRLSRKATKLSTLGDQSITCMVKHWEGGEKIIDNPRDYQLELFERAKTQNTIAVLDTGSGKTLIAALLIEHTINQELEDRVKGKPRRVCFFLVDKVALAFQQHAVLETNLPHSVAVFSGQKVPWNQEFWIRELEKNEVIVCTAEILNICLQYAYVRIDQINLLIFDEAHHTKKNHAYARIVKNYYLEGKKRGLRIPRIFGMTASPVDALIDVRQAAVELEGMLDSMIATTTDIGSLHRTVSRPKDEVVIHYDPLLPHTLTDLSFKLRPLLGSNILFSKAFSFADLASRELGTCFVDRMWQLFLEDAEALKLEVRTGRSLTKEKTTISVVERQQSAIKASRDITANHIFSVTHENSLSSKVKKLIEILSEQFRDKNMRCIVFVERRWTAKLLADFFEQGHAGISELKVASLMGANMADGTWSTPASFRSQIKTIIDFKKGLTNCIFATSVAEEGLDIPDCNLIIRFDLCKTMIQYIQSRGRARQANSVYIHLAELGNGDHRRRLHQNAESEAFLRRFCKTQPEDRLLKGSNYDMEYFLREERNQGTHVVESTGAKLTFHNSLTILAEFANSLRNIDDYEEGVGLVPSYSTTAVQGGFICEILMPPLSPVCNASGKIYSRKQVAKCSAAYEVCLKLLKGKWLDENLRSKFVMRRHIMANAQLAVSSKKRAKYDMRSKPLLWSRLGAPEELHATMLTLSRPAALGRASRPLLILTREALPRMKPFALFFGPEEQGMTSDIICQTSRNSVPVTVENLHLLTKFTLKVFLDIFNKRYAASAAELPYFFAAASIDHQFVLNASWNPLDTIDWRLLEHVSCTDAESYSGNEQDSFFSEKYIVDPHDGSRRFWLRGVRRDLSHESPVPPEVDHQPSYREWKKGEVAHNIMNWSVTAWRATRETRMKTWQDKKPVVVSGSFVPLRRNFLADIREECKNPICYFILEPMRISPLAADVVATAYLLPSIIHRIEQTLIALEACKLLQLDIHPDLALQAFTKDSDNSDEAKDGDSVGEFEPINFQPGMGENYERLELLGDSFLKMATTISIFTLIPNRDEFDYHCERMVMICNKNLFNVALSDDIKLQEYIRTRSFQRGTWYPMLRLEFGKTHLVSSKQMDEHRLADKSIADVCEALIGAAYMTTRKTNDYTMAIQAVTRFVKNKRHPMTKWEDYHAAYRMPEWQKLPASAAELDMAQKIEDITGYAFNNPRGLRSAFRHPSRPYEFDKVPTYQRLEFLGDALYDMVCVDWLFHVAPDKGPQWLTEHKMAMVSNQFLGCLAVSLNFHKFILHNQPALRTQIHEYVTEIDEARRAAEDKAEALGKPRSAFSRDFWIEVRLPPKCLPDVLEAYLGAIFVDSRYDYSVIQRFFADHVLPYFSDLHVYDTFANKHPVTFATQFIYETFGCHAYGLHAEETQVTDELEKLTGRTQVVAGVLVHAKVVDVAVRESGRYAKIAAARKAVEKLKRMTREEFIGEYACDCKPGDAPEDIGESATAI